MNDHDIQGPLVEAARPRLLDLARETIRRRHYSYGPGRAAARLLPGLNSGRMIAQKRNGEGGPPRCCLNPSMQA